MSRDDRSDLVLRVGRLLPPVPFGVAEQCVVLYQQVEATAVMVASAYNLPENHVRNAMIFVYQNTGLSWAEVIADARHGDGLVQRELRSDDGVSERRRLGDTDA